MTKTEFNILNVFVLKNLKKNNPFVITTTRFFKIINHDIHLRKGHNELYEGFLKNYKEAKVPYNVEHCYRFENADEQFDLSFEM